MNICQLSQNVKFDELNKNLHLFSLNSNTGKWSFQTFRFHIHINSFESILRLFHYIDNLKCSVYDRKKVDCSELRCKVCFFFLSRVKSHCVDTTSKLHAGMNVRQREQLNQLIFVVVVSDESNENT